MTAAIIVVISIIAAGVIISAFALCKVAGNADKHNGDK